MSVFRFIHSSDLHLGRRFASIAQPPDGNIRGRLMEARHGAIAALAAAARGHGAQHIVLAGDTFDSPTPSAPIRAQGLAAMALAPDLTWWILPGNHDNLRQSEPLWDALRRDAPTNVHAIVVAGPVEIEPGVTLLPAPVTHRNPGRDLSADLDGMPSPDGHLRLGLAHGGVTDFSDGSVVIAPDRDRLAGLDYLALGDWHGQLAIGPRVQYSGTPEPDSFRHDKPGICLGVSLDGAGALPQVAPIGTGHFCWRALDLTLTDDQDAGAALGDLLPQDARRDTLVQIHARGWARLPGHAALRAAAERIGPEFAYLDLRTDALGTAFDVADLDDIDRAGALRLAAEALRATAGDTAGTADDRDIAAAALTRLYAYTQEGAT